MKYWESNSILSNYNSETPPKEIYQAVCNCIGKYFIEKGFKYSKSIPKITRKNKEFKLDIIFRSSGSNTAGEYVNLEINGYLYSLELTKLNPGDKGHLNDSTTALSKVLGGDYHKGTKFVENILGETISYVERHTDMNRYTLNRNVNLYGITEDEFTKILDFIEFKIIDWLDKLADKDTMMNCLRACSEHSKMGLRRLSFLNYVEMKYPKMMPQVEKELNTNR